MERLKKILLLLLAALPLIAFSTKRANPKTIALLIGVGDYNADTSWDDLNSEYDLQLIKEALMVQGIEEREISLLKSKEATREGILKAIETELIKKAKRGGTAIFHFSGHGQQIRDDNNDELDGFDEAIVPVNSKKFFEAGINEGENLIRDDELERLFSELRKKLGPKGHLLVTMDACHSGTGTRGYLKARGSDVIMADPDYIDKYQQISTKERGYFEEEEEKNKAPLVALFSSSARQLSYEYRNENNESYGLMSFALSKALLNAKRDDSYQVLFDKVKMQVSTFTSLQTPQAEGRLNQGILNGKVSGKPNYFLVKEKAGPGLVTVNVGRINGVHEHSTVAFYPIGTKNLLTAKPLAKGKVIYSSLLECDVELEENIAKKTILQTWVLIKDKNYGNLNINVNIDIGDETLKDAISKEIQQLPIVHLVEKNADLQIQTSTAFAGEDELQIVMPDGFSIFTKKLNHSNQSLLISNIKRQLLNYAQVSFLRKLEVADDELKVNVDFLTAHEMELVSKDKLRFEVGEKLKIRFTNTGSKACYFSVLNIQSNHVINPIIPFGRRTAEEYFLKPGEQYLFEEDLNVSFPTGIEMLKIMLTPEPIDLNSVIETRGASTRGKTNSHPLEVLFSQSFLDEDSRGEETINIPSGSVGLQTLLFETFD